MRKVICRAGFDPRFGGAVQKDDAQREPEPAEAAGNDHEVMLPEAGKKMKVNEAKEVNEVKDDTRKYVPSSPLLPSYPLHPLLPFICPPRFLRWLRCNARKWRDSAHSLPRAWNNSSSARTSCRRRAARSPRGPARLRNETLRFPR